MIVESEPATLSPGRSIAKSSLPSQMIPAGTPSATTIRTQEFSLPASLPWYGITAPPVSSRAASRSRLLGASCSSKLRPSASKFISTGPAAPIFWLPSMLAPLMLRRCSGSWWEREIVAACAAIETLNTAHAANHRTPDIMYPGTQKSKNR